MFHVHAASIPSFFTPIIILFFIIGALSNLSRLGNVENPVFEEINVLKFFKEVFGESLKLSSQSNVDKLTMFHSQMSGPLVNSFKAAYLSRDPHYLNKHTSNIHQLAGNSNGKVGQMWYSFKNGLKNYEGVSIQTMLMCECNLNRRGGFHADECSSARLVRPALISVKKNDEVEQKEIYETILYPTNENDPSALDTEECFSSLFDINGSKHHINEIVEAEKFKNDDACIDINYKSNDSSWKNLQFKATGYRGVILNCTQSEIYPVIIKDVNDKDNPFSYRTSLLNLSKTLSHETYGIECQEGDNAVLKKYILFGPLVGKNNKTSLIRTAINGGHWYGTQQFDSVLGLKPISFLQHEKEITSVEDIFGFFVTSVFALYTTTSFSRPEFAKHSLRTFLSFIVYIFVEMISILQAVYFIVVENSNSRWTSEIIEIGGTLVFNGNPLESANGILDVDGSLVVINATHGLLKHIETRAIIVNIIGFLFLVFTAVGNYVFGSFTIGNEYESIHIDDFNHIRVFKDISLMIAFIYIPWAIFADPETHIRLWCGLILIYISLFASSIFYIHRVCFRYPRTTPIH